ncbi:MAG TPA: ArsA family ATPase [Polyangia bacterium]|nr:ArsA family ATPase [Polyangia bacterium]
MAATTSAASSFRFFGGKGGVGKTTCAASYALKAADRGARVLVVSTDPAHSLGDALDVKLGAKPKRVAPRLDAVELDADRALARWLDERRRTLRDIFERGTYLDREDLDGFFALSLPGVDELVGLVELTRLASEGDYEQVVVDTAPTGHTLRLMAMPGTLRQIAAVLADMQEKHQVMAEALGGGRRRDAADVLIDDIDRQGTELAALLRDRARVKFSWVTLPEAMAVAETGDALAALGEMEVDELIVNRVTPGGERCPLCDARRGEERRAIADARALAGERAVRELAAADEEPRGLAALRDFGRERKPRRERAPAHERKRARDDADARGDADAGELSVRVQAGVRLLMFGGKGGVGKTTCAAAAALAAAPSVDGDVLLLSTDPAHSLGDALAMEIGDEPKRLAKNLWARELDADRAFAARREEYRQAVDELFDRLRKGSRFDASYDRRVVQDLIDLAPPGIDELFAVLTVIDALAAEKYRLVIVDTAPTGHALRLLRLPAEAQEWVRALLQLLLKYREVAGLGRLAEELLELARDLRGLSELLADPARARFVAVARAAELPVAETARLMASLDELGVAAGAIVVNALTPPGCARCRRAAAVERRRIAELGSRARGRAILLAPAVAPPPRGVEALAAFTRRWRVQADRS